MNRSYKILFTILIILVAFLAGTSSYFYSKNRSLNQKSNSSEVSSQSTKQIDTATTSKSTKGAENKTTTAATEPAPLKDRPSSPSDTYKVESGDTLYSIATKFDTSWPKLMEANGMEDANKVKVGESLIVPKNNQVSFTVNEDQAQILQKDADSGKASSRLDPVETAKSDSSPVYGLGTSDKYVQKDIDKNSGTATVIATHTDKRYEISLSQPETKGDKGIWAIDSIKPVE